MTEIEKRAYLNGAWRAALCVLMLEVIWLIWWWIR
jgi:hypothetical protein